MKTDYEKTGKLYAKLEAYTKGNASQAMPDTAALYYFCSTVQFKTCKSFKAFLEQRHKGHGFKVSKAKE
jgi:hypothetical protein